MRRTRAYAVLLFAVWSLWLSGEYLFFGRYSYVYLHDNGDSLLPARLELSHALRNSGFSLWNPHELTGIDRLSASLSADADTLLYVALPGWLAYGLVLWGSAFAAGYFTYRLLREAFGAGAVAAAAAGLAYALYD